MESLSVIGKPKDEFPAESHHYSMLLFYKFETGCGILKGLKNANSNGVHELRYGDVNRTGQFYITFIVFRQERYYAGDLGGRMAFDGCLIHNRNITVAVKSLLGVANLVIWPNIQCPQALLLLLSFTFRPVYIS